MVLFVERGIRAGDCSYLVARYDRSLANTLGQQTCIFRIGELLFPPDVSSCGIVMQFNRVSGPVEDLHMWSATSNGFSFVISFETRNGPGLRGRHGYLASWRPLHQSRCAIKVGGSPFPTLVEAEIACTAVLAHLIRPG